ncbi:MAG: hypothetical protein WBO37_05545 [Gammaproteobacteria bacterium]
MIRAGIARLSEPTRYRRRVTRSAGGYGGNSQIDVAPEYFEVHRCESESLLSRRPVMAAALQFMYVQVTAIAEKGEDHDFTEKQKY